MFNILSSILGNPFTPPQHHQDIAKPTPPPHLHAPLPANEAVILSQRSRAQLETEEATRNAKKEREVWARIRRRCSSGGEAIHFDFRISQETQTSLQGLGYTVEIEEDESSPSTWVRWSTPTTN